MTRLIRIEFYRLDLVLRFWRNGLRLNWWRAMVVWVILWLVDTAFYAYVAGLFSSTPNVIGFLDDLSGSVLVALWCGAVLVAYYVWCGGAFESLIWKLLRNSSLRSVSQFDSAARPLDGYLLAVTKLERLWNHPLAVLGPLVVAVAWTLFVFRPMADNWPRIWWNVTSYRNYYFVKMGVVTFIVLRVVAMEVLGVVSLRYLVTHNVLSFQPFHPDRAGGLLPIGQYRLALVYGLAGLSAFFVFTAFGHTLNVGDIAIYALMILALPLFFFVPLSFIHSFMKSEKSKLIAPVAQAEEVKLREMKTMNQFDIEEQAKDLDTLNRLMHELQGLPEWPVDASVLRRFLSSWLAVITSPAVGVLLARLLEVPLIM